jgi:hypothetical protein
MKMRNLVGQPGTQLGELQTLENMALAAHKMLLAERAWRTY